MVGWRRADYNPPFISRVFSLVVAACARLRALAHIQPVLRRDELGAFLAFLLYPVNLSLRRRLHGRGRAAGVLTVLTPIVILLPLSALCRSRSSRKSPALMRTVPAAGARARHQELLGSAAVSADRPRERLASGARRNFRRSGPLLGDLRDAGSLAARRRALGVVFPGRAGVASSDSRSCCSCCSFSARRRCHVRARARTDSAGRGSARTGCFGSSRASRGAIVLGTTLTALMQGVLVGIGFAIAGLPSPVVFGVLVALLAMLPVGGAAIVWVPAVGWLLYEGRWGYAIFMLAWGLMLVGARERAAAVVDLGTGANFGAGDIRRGAGRDPGVRRHRHHRGSGGAVAWCSRLIEFAEETGKPARAKRLYAVAERLAQRRSTVQSAPPWTYLTYSTG